MPPCPPNTTGRLTGNPNSPKIVADAHRGYIACPIEGVGRVRRSGYHADRASAGPVTRLQPCSDLNAMLVGVTACRIIGSSCYALRGTTMRGILSTCECRN